MIDWGRGEVVASSFDLPHERHVAVADMVFEHARRQVELGKDVVIVLDSLTRLARSHNTTGRGSGRTMSGGLDANALAKPKGLFGSARACPKVAPQCDRHGAHRDGEPDGRRDLRGVQGDRQFGAAPVPRAGRPPPLSRRGCRRERHTARGAARGSTDRAAKQQLRRGLVGLPPEKAIDTLLAQLRRRRPTPSCSPRPSARRQFPPPTMRL